VPPEKPIPRSSKGLNVERQFWCWAKNIQGLWILIPTYLKRFKLKKERISFILFYSADNMIFEQIKSKSKNKAEKD